MKLPIVWGLIFRRNVIRGLTFGRDIIWGLIFGVVFTAILQGAVWLLSEPDPYKDVVVDNVEKTDSGYIVTASFIKTDCKFKRLEVFGVNTGIPIYLEWEALDGSPSTDYDRSIGKQHLVILAITAGGDYDAIEIRTRHDCGGAMVDKVFAKIVTEEWSND